MDHHVGAELDGPLDGRAREGVVDDQLHAMSMRDLGGGRQVRQAHHRVRRRLDEQHLRLGRERRFDEIQLRRIHIAELERIPSQHALEQPERPAIGVVGDDDVIAGLEKGGNRGDSGHAGGEREGAAARLDGGEVGFERRPRRVLRPRVLVAFVLAKRVLDVGRGLKDRRDDGAGRRVGLLSGMNAQRREMHVFVEFHQRVVTISSNFRDRPRCRL